MIIYVMRHQIRDSNIFFNTPLNTDGHYLAQTVTKDELNKRGITKIYSSPFLRTLQTIEPYLNQNQNNLNVNLEYSLYEYLHSSLFTDKNYLGSLDKNLYHKFRINSSYISYLDQYLLKYPERIYDVKLRVKNFIEMLVNKYKDTNEVILLVTHMQIIHSMLNILNLHIPNDGINMGKIIRIK